MPYLIHYGLKGQKWGVRRFENADGTLTEEGKRRYRAMSTQKDAESIFKTFSKEDRRLFDAGADDSEYMTKEAAGYWVYKRFMAKDGNMPVAFLDVIKGANSEKAVIAIGTRSDYRGKGYAAKVVKRGEKWIDEHINELGTVEWGAHTENTSSIALAKKGGFKFDREAEGYSIYKKGVS